MRKKGFRHECKFVTNCTCSTAKLINLMIEKALPIRRRTFLSHIYLDDLYNVLPYTRLKKTGMRLQDDYHLTYYRSWFNGKVCYYVVWSAIEFIFIDKELL